MAPPLTAMDADRFQQHAKALLTPLYGERSEEVLRRLLRLIEAQGARLSHRHGARTELWSEKDQWLILYGDSLIDEHESRSDSGQETSPKPPLAVLDDFLHSRLAGVFSGVHVLPFFPWSSDDGFSVIHYREVDPALGEWRDIRRLASRHDLMVDLVLNHVSRESLWFADYLGGNLPGRDYFIEMDPETDLSDVVRPRSSPLLVPVSTRRGVRHLWATFSEDQIDLNFANPDVLIEFIGILLFYLQQGARIVRLDAVAFLWKRPGTRCIHLPETHAVVRLLRAIVDHVAPGTLIITETNVPHAENISYFGLEREHTPPDEAHLVYQFPLPPLLLHTLTSGEAGTIARWLNTLPELPEGCSYLNFTASHDGIGVRPLEGWLEQHEIDALVGLMQRFGGFVSMRRQSDGSDSPYELNITWFDAMSGTRRGPDPWQVERFLLSQHLMLVLKGIPGVYIHCLTATQNDHDGVERSGRLRSINRKRWQRQELGMLLDSRHTPTREVFVALTRRLELRRREPCFHPDAAQTVVPTAPQLLAIQRGPIASGRRLLAIHNVTDRPQPLVMAELERPGWEDLLEGGEWRHCDTLAPYRSLWLVRHD
ncbi:MULTISPECIES: sugar phosphorylase [unclassified Halomonas]|uniref:sugar phosphorylase n=1 Tax=unclassified Halomonas TaxID=2609666 RepID=UPI0021BDD248|nr:MULTISPECIES: sugar phosphorylase [unclassified Halomonas]